MSVFWSKDNKYKWAIQMQRGVGESISLFMFYSFFRVGKSYSLSASSLYQCQWTTSIAYTHFQTAISIGISVLTYWQPSPALTKSEFSGRQVKKTSQRRSICGLPGKCILLAIYSDQLCLPLWDCAADQESWSGYCQLPFGCRTLSGQCSSLPSLWAFCPCSTQHTYSPVCFLRMTATT